MVLSMMIPEVPMARSVSRESMPPKMNKALSVRTEQTAETTENSEDFMLGESLNLSDPFEQHDDHLKLESEELVTPHLDWSFLEEGELFGREEEVVVLEEAFQRKLEPSSAGYREIVLVSGPSGTGKTALVRKALQELVHQHSGFFLLGKFDQLCYGCCSTTQEPYAPLVAALTQWAVFLEANPQLFGIIREKLISNICEEARQVLCALVPAFCTICDLSHDQTPFNTYEGQQDRLQVALTKLFQTLCCREQPVVLVIDDLQWADKASLDLLEALASDSTLVGFMVLGICRSNEVSVHHDFASMLRRLEDEKQTTIVHVALQNLDVGPTSALLARILHQPQHLCQQLASIIHDKTEGNVFFTMQLVRTLHERGVLVAERLTSTNNYKQWTWHDEEWDLALFRQEDFAVSTLVTNQIQSLPTLCRKFLKTAACIGAEFDLDVILAVSDDGNEEDLPSIPEMTSPALEERLLVQQICTPGRYAFAHDRIQQCAYALIAEEDRPNCHLGIGRKLLKKLDPQQLQDKLFLVVNQLLRGASLLKTETDRTNLAGLCLKAGKKATDTCNFATALSYFQTGIHLLPPRHWRDEYHLSLDLYSSKAEAEGSLACFDDVDATVEEVLSNCRTKNDKTRGYLAKIYSLGVRSDFRSAIDLGLAVLDENYGEKFPAKPGILQLIPELLKTQRRLKKVSDDDILNLPLIDPHDRARIAASKILKLLCIYVFCEEPDLYPFLVLRWVKITLKYGISDATPIGIGSYGCLLCAIGNFDEAYRYARLSLRLLDERCNSRSLMLPRVHLMFYGVISHWKRPLRSLMDPLRLAVSSAIDAGDYECAIFTSYNLIVHGFVCGTKLSVVDGWVKQYLPMMERQQGPWLALATIQQQLMDNLMGNSENPLELNFHLEESTQTNYNFRLYTSACMTNRLILSYHFGHYDVALASALASRKIEKVIRTSIMIVYLYFYDGLTALELAATKKGWKRRTYISRAKKIIHRIEKFAVAGPENVLHKLYLLRGEMSAVKGDLKAAMGWYQKAIQHASQEGVLQLEALGYERSAVALQRLGNSNDAEVRSQLEEAISRYQDWGALAIAKHLKGKQKLLKS